MTTIGAAAAPSTRERGQSQTRSVPLMLLPGATAVAVLGLALLVLLAPVFMHAALDFAGAPDNLGLSRTETLAASDRTVGELLLGPGTFAFAGTDGRPFYDADEQAHMRNVRTALYAFLGLAALSGAFTLASLARGRRDPRAWRAVARGGAALVVALLAIGVFALLAFDTAFELFHVLLFPGGNWAFDSATQRLVQLYPLPFWQLAAGALGAIGVAAGLGLWVVGRRRAQALAKSG